MQMVPDLQWFNLPFLDFTVVQKQYTSSRNHTSSFEFWSFPQLASCGTTLSCDSGGGSKSQLPINHGMRRINNQHTYNQR